LVYASTYCGIQLENRSFIFLARFGVNEVFADFQSNGQYGARALWGSILQSFATAYYNGNVNGTHSADAATFSLDV
jgi:hypothetical protein